MSNWKVQVTLHNIVNIPSAACTGGEKAFVVELHLQNALAHSLRAPTASVMFTSSEVTENTPGLFEKRLDGEGQSDANPQVWTCTAPLLEITATVKELLVPPTSRRITESDLRVVGTSAPFSVSVKEITEETKLKTIVLGCEMGQIGVSLSVDPSDKDGYRRRLRDFLTRHNPKGLRLLESVVESVPELDTFTKLFRKYKIKNYEERLANFFKVYGPEHVGQIQPLLQQWEGREEELMRNMILDNGPELCDVDPRARLDAFLGAHQLARSDPRVKAILERYPSGKDSSRWERLVSQFGPEPDPRTYAFTPVYYEAATRKTASSPTPRSSTRNDPTRVEEEAPTPSDGYSPNPVKPAARGPLEDKLLSLAFTPKIDFGSGDKKEAPPKPWARPPSSRQEEASAYPSKPLASVFDENKFGPSFSREVVPVTRDVEDTIRSPDGLWRKMCKVLQSKRGVEPWQLFYGNKEYFIDLLDSLDLFVKDERKTLIGEWQRRALEAVAEEPLHTGSSYFYSASHEAALILRVKPISLQVLGITNVRNKEHILGFNAITAEQGASACVERLALVGEEAALRKVVQEGAGVWSAGLSAAHPSGIVFPKEPFLHWKEARTTCVLLCDVAVGRHYTEKQAGGNPSQSTLKEDYDSVLYRDPISGPCLLVHRPQQVLPRLLLQCTVDPNVLPCDAHPDRAVEFYVVDSDKFVCSQCAVLGEFKGHHIVSLEEAATTGRHKLSHIQRTAEDIAESMNAFAKQLQDEEERMANAPRRQRARKEMERIQREAEERIKNIRQAVEVADKEQADRIANDRSELEATRRKAEELAQRVAAAMQSKAPLEVVRALQGIQQEREVDHILSRAHDRLPEAPLEKVLPLDAPPSLRGAPSASRPPTYHPNHVAGLNESYADQSTLNVFRRPPNFSAAPSPLPAKSKDASSINASDLYKRYIATAPQKGKARPATGTPVAQASGTQPSHSTRASSQASSVASSTVTSVRKLPSPDADLAKGWSLLRQGKEDEARAVWGRVVAQHGEDTLWGAKARAYTAEALDKDFPTAARHYEVSLQLDPQDRMTAYNYGVLLEAVLRQPARALQLYERAAALGDLVASTRARQLRQMLAEGENGEEEEDDDDSEEEGEEEESQASSQGL